MRYYIYLDKQFLRTLFSIYQNSDFDIEVIEYSVRKSFTSNNEVRVEPCIENMCDGEEICRCDTVKEESRSSRNSNLNKERVGVLYDKGNAYNIQTERKYLNIEDISDMKNISFYHKLLGKIIDSVRDDKSRIIEESGYIKICNNEIFENEKNNFFMINETFVWFDNTLLQGDISLLSQMACKIKVLGYIMSCKESKNRKIVKAIAMYIE